MASPHKRRRKKMNGGYGNTEPADAAVDATPTPTPPAPAPKVAPKPKKKKKSIFG